MAQLWERMARIYGHKWTSAYDVADDGTWLTGLQGLTPAELATGLRACIQHADDWPPTLPNFRRLCLVKDPVARLAYIPARTETAAEVKMRIEAAEPWLAKAWATLGRNSKCS